MHINKSKMNAEKKMLLISELRLLTKTKFKLNDAKTLGLIQKFTDELFEQAETRDEDCQTELSGSTMDQETQKYAMDALDQMMKKMAILSQSILEMAS